MCITSGESVVSAGSSSPVPNCSHEEADTRVVVHILHALKQGWKTIQVRTVDTAVVTMLVGTYHDLALTQPFGDIWVIFWHRQALQILQHKYHLYKPQRAKIRRAAYIPCFLWLRHKSAFKGKGKKSVWKVGMSMGRSQKHLSIWHATRSSCCMLTLHISKRLRNWLPSCTTRAVH